MCNIVQTLKATIQQCEDVETTDKLLDVLNEFLRYRLEMSEKVSKLEQEKSELRVAFFNARVEASQLAKTIAGLPREGLDG